MTPDEVREIREDHRKTGERLASIETLLRSNSEILSEMRQKLDSKADAMQINTLVKKVDDLMERDGSIEKDLVMLKSELQSLKNIRKNDFWWFSAIAAAVGMVASVVVVVVAAFIQK